MNSKIHVSFPFVLRASNSNKRFIFTFCKSDARCFVFFSVKMLRQRTVSSAGGAAAGGGGAATYTDWEDEDAEERASLSWTALRREPRLWATLAVAGVVAVYYAWVLLL